MSKQKIALVYDAIYPYVKGGAEKRFYDLGKQLTKNGHEVHLYGMKFWKGADVIKKDGMYLHGLCKAKNLYGKKGKRRFSQTFIFGLSCLKMIREDFDAIDCCGIPFTSLFSCKLVTTLRRKKLISTWHEVWGKKYWREYVGRLGIFGYFVERFAARLPDEFIAVSTHTAKRLKRELKVRRPIHLIENGIDLKHIASVKADIKKSDIIYAGRLAPYKRIDVLVSAMQHLPNRKLTIIGEGPERSSLNDLAARLKVDKQITFYDFQVRHDAVIAAMKASRVFVLPSEREGFGIVVIEANAAGLPVVTVDNKSNAARHLISKDNGFVTKLSDKAIAKAIKQVLQHTPNPTACRSAVRAFDWPDLTKKVEKVLL